MGSSPSPYTLPKLSSSSHSGASVLIRGVVFFSSTWLGV